MSKNGSSVEVKSDLKKKTWKGFQILKFNNPVKISQPQLKMYAQVYWWNMWWQVQVKASTIQHLRYANVLKCDKCKCKNQTKT